jgi:hypothetical protein
MRIFDNRRAAFIGAPRLALCRNGKQRTWAHCGLTHAGRRAGTLLVAAVRRTAGAGPSVAGLPLVAPVNPLVPVIVSHFLPCRASAIENDSSAGRIGEAVNGPGEGRAAKSEREPDGTDRDDRAHCFPRLL